MRRVLSLGAGVQSSALLLLFDREPEMVGGSVDLAVFADTVDEPAEVYAWLDTLRANVSVPIVIARKSAAGLSADQLARRTGARSPWFTLVNGEGRGMLPRNCTRDYKIRPIEKAVKAQFPIRRGGGVQVRQMIGISIDEAHRMKPSRTAWVENHWPLVDLGWTRNDCRRYVEASGLGTPPRSSCLMCPFHSNAEWKAIRSRPDDWDRVVTFDRGLRLISKDMGITSEVFLHRDRVPIDAVDFDPDSRQMDLWGNECEGHCGV